MFMYSSYLPCTWLVLCGRQIYFCNVLYERDEANPILSGSPVHVLTKLRVKKGCSFGWWHLVFYVFPHPFYSVGVAAGFFIFESN